MRWNTFGRSLLFAALAAAGAVPWLVLARPFLGAQAALAVYLVAVTAAYLGGLAPQRRRRVAVLVVTTVLGCGIAVASRTLTELVLGLAVLLATARSGFLYRAPAARAVVTEAILVGTGLLFARFLAAGAPIGVMLALWGFLLVQSAYFLVGGVRVRVTGGGHPDPFEEAHSRALALLDGGEA